MIRSVLESWDLDNYISRNTDITFSFRNIL